MKQLLNKSILEYRNTPIDKISSPAQFLMSCRLRTCIPTVAKRLKPEVVNSKKAQAQTQQQKTQQRYYHDQGSKELPPPAKGDKAFMQVRGEWVPVAVTAKRELQGHTLSKLQMGRSTIETVDICKRLTSKHPTPQVRTQTFGMTLYQWNQHV